MAKSEKIKPASLDETLEEVAGEVADISGEGKVALGKGGKDDAPERPSRAQLIEELARMEAQRDRARKHAAEKADECKKLEAANKALLEEVEAMKGATRLLAEERDEAYEKGRKHGNEEGEVRGRQLGSVRIVKEGEPLDIPVGNVRVRVIRGAKPVWMADADLVGDGTPPHMRTGSKKFSADHPPFVVVDYAVVQKMNARGRVLELVTP